LTARRWIAVKSFETSWRAFSVSEVSDRRILSGSRRGDHYEIGARGVIFDSGLRAARYAR
jgi:hypothetical protein